MMTSVRNFPQLTAVYLVSAEKMNCGIWETASLYQGLALTLSPNFLICTDSMQQW
jgi:hypothetical protein